MAGDDSVTTLDINQARAQLTENAYGKDKADKVKSLRDDIQKAQFDARKSHQAAITDVMEKRKDFVKDIENFWSKTIQQSPLGERLEEGDLAALESLQDLKVTYSTEDPREYDVEFSFGDNAYFSDKTLKKCFKVPSEIKKDLPYDLEAPTATRAIKISWKDDKHNLVKLKPMPDVTKMEEYDEFDGAGSFFNFFTEEDDAMGTAEALEDIYMHALDIYAGLSALEGGESDMSDDDEDEDDDDAEDPAAEIDLGDSEDDLPKKKRQRN